MTLWLAMVIIGVQAGIELCKTLYDFVKERVKNRNTTN